MRNIFYPALLFFLLMLSQNAFAQSCTGTSVYVTNINPTGLGSLTSAINCLNSNSGTDTVRFNIDIPNAQINGSGYPNITSSNAVIVGRNEFDNQKIILSGDGSSTTLGINAAGVKIFNLVIEDNDTGINSLNQDGLELNNIDFDLLQTAINFDGVTKSDILNCVIGNVQQFGIRLIDGQDNNVEYTDITGATAGAAGFFLEDQDNFLIENCKIDGGSKADNGIEITYPSGAGYRGTVRLNDIFNWEKGIEIAGGVGEGVYISRNSFYCNSIIGIDTDFSIPEPVITSASSSSIKGTGLVGYSVEVFYNDVTCTGVCQGENHIETVAVNASGQWTVNGTFTTGVEVTATQTKTLGTPPTQTFRNTSEFSACAFVSNCPTGSLVTVKNTNNAGFESLRWACDCVNNVPSITDIDFDIGTGGAVSINLTSALPTIIKDNFFIDGNNPSTASGSRVTVNGASISGNPTGLGVIGSDPRIEDILIRDFGGNGLVIAAASPNASLVDVSCSDNGFNGMRLLGDNASVFQCEANDNGTSGAYIADDLTVIDDCSFKNNPDFGIHLFASSNTEIKNSLFTGNAFGIYVEGGDDFFIENNIIGAIGNGNIVAGVYFSQDVGNTFSNPFGTIELNTIEDNGQGIILDESFGNVRAIISENSINCNPNGGIFQTTLPPPPPVIDFATPTFISGTGGTTGTPVEVFINTDCSSAPCQGKTYLGTAMPTSGAWALTIPSGLLSPGEFVTATVSSAINTSEFAACVLVGPACPTSNPVVITNTNDSGDNSLRWGIECVNNNAALDEIEFSIGTGNQTIMLASPLPGLDCASLNIDGSTQPGGGLITIDGSSFTPDRGLYNAGRDDLVIRKLKLTGFTDAIHHDDGDRVELYDLELTNNSGRGVFLEGGGFGVVSGILAENNATGIYSDSHFGIDILNSTFTDNTQNGVRVSRSLGAVVQGNIIDGGGLSTVGVLFDSPTSKPKNGNAPKPSSGYGTVIQNDITGNATGLEVTYSLDLNIRENSIYCNSISGITRVPNVPAPPIIGTATTALISGTAIADATVELFIDDDTGCPGSPIQGKTYLGSTTASPTGDWSFVPGATPVVGGDMISATNTTVVGALTTSAFSNAVAAAAACPNGTTVTVLNTNPDGDYSLYWALECVATDPVLDTIKFDITSGSPIEIFPTTQLPFITDEGTFVDGSSQPTGDRIYIDGSAAPSVFYGFEAVGPAVDMKIEGVALVNWSQDGMQLQGADDALISDVVFSGNGDIGLRNAFSTGVVVEDCLFENNARGLFSNSGITVRNSTATNNTDVGIELLNADNSVLEQLTVTQNQIGISLETSDGVEIKDTQIDGNTVQGVEILQSAGLNIHDNEITNSGNQGLLVYDYLGTNPSSGIINNNDFYDNGSSGVFVVSPDEPIQISQNSIYCNAGFGINRVGNNPIIPVITSATNAAVSGTSAEPNVTVEIFVDDNTGCAGVPEQGKVFIGTTTADGAGDWTFLVPSGSILSGDLVTATSTYLTFGALNTSQFSTGVVAGLACPSSNPVIVTNANDSGDESMRWACDCVNNDPNLWEINFIIGTGDVPIDITSAPLPALLPDNVIIDGSTQPGGSVRLVGTGLASGHGLEFEGNDFTVKRIIVTDFPNSGIYTENTSGGLFESMGVSLNGAGSGVFLKTTSNMTFDDFNAGGQANGIKDLEGDMTEIRNSLFQGNVDGVEFEGATNFLVENNQFGGVDPGEPNTGAAIRVIQASPGKPGKSTQVIQQKFANFTGTIQFNDIYGNGTGVFVEDPFSGNSFNILISENSMFCNTVEGITKSSPSFPVITAAYPNLVTGTAIPDSDVEIFAHGDPRCSTNHIGQGKFYLGTVSADSNGDWDATGLNIALGDSLVATATDVDTDFNTSAFSALRIVVPPPCDAMTSSTNISCHGAMDGTGTSIGAAGTPPYSFAWSGGNVTSTTLQSTTTDLGPGTYYVTVTDDLGCIDIDTIMITQPDSIELNLSAYDVTCFGGNDGQIFSNVIGGTPAPSSPFYSYLWSNGATDADLFNLTAGRYYLTVTDAVGCTNVDSIDVFEPAKLIVDIDSTNVDCYGGNTGSATVNLSGAGITVSWSNGATTPTISNLIAGKYIVTATDGLCVDVDSVMIEQPDSIEMNLSAYDVSCYGGNDGQVFSNVIGGTPSASSPFYTYLWSTGATTLDLFGVSAGRYYLTVTDANGCMNVDSIDVFEPARLIVDIDSTNIDCFGGNTGSATVNLSGAGITVSWSNGATTPTISNLVAGTYYVSATDGFCVDVDSVMIEQTDSIELNLSAYDVTCFGGNDGEAFSNVIGGTPAPSSPFYSYLWSNGETDLGLFNLTAGRYYLTVTDAVGCMNVDSIDVFEPAKLIVDIDSTNVDCYGGNTGSATVNLSGAGITVSWSNGATTPTISNLIAGKYIVTATDGLCVDVDSVMIEQTDSIELNLSAYDVTCFGGNGGQAFSNVIGGTPAPSSPFYSYLWSNGETDSDLFNLTAGRYYLTVTDAVGCTNIDSIDVFEPAKLIVDIDSTNILCFGGDTGSATVNLSGSGITVMWSNGETTETINDLVAGTYYVSATDGFCSDVDSVMIEQEPEILTMTDSVDFVCFNDGNGQAIVAASGGTPGTPQPYTYNWSTTPPQNAPIIFVPSGGMYYVTVTDGNLCPKVDSIFVNEPDSLQVSISSLDISCFGDDDGLATANATGGDPSSYEYIWSIPQFTQTISGLSPGTYSVTVEDGNLCSDTASVRIIEPPKIIISTAGTDANCFGQADGSATVNVIGNPLDYTYDWSNGDITQTTSATLAAGTYTVTVTEDPSIGYCQDTMSVVIGEPDLLVATVSGTDITCFGLDDGIATVSATGGDPATYSYLWSTGATTATISSLPPGTYDVTVTDGNGCSDITFVDITEPAKLIISTSGTDVTCFGFGDGTATVSVTGDPLNYDYDWSNGETTQAISNLTPGIYIVTVTDNTSGIFTCTDTMSVVIAEPDVLQVTISATDATCFDSDDGDAIANVIGGQVGTYTYSWDNGGTTQFIGGLAPGSYTVTVLDANSCQDIATATIAEPDKIIVSMSGSDVVCFDDNNGFATVNVVGDSLIYDYVWSNGPITKSIFNLGTGNYKVTVTEDTGVAICTDTASVNIAEPDELVLDFLTIDVTCFAGSDGETSAQVGGGIPDYSFLWSNSATTFAITNLSQGDYSVTVTDANGCTIEDTETVNQPLEFTADIDATDVSCFDFADGTATALTDNGIAPFSYDWSNATTNQTATGLAPGTYSVIVTDQTLCTTTASVDITQPTAMTLDFDITNVSCFGDFDGFVQANAGGATPPYSYSWSNGFTDDFQFDLVAGTYTLTLTDDNGCEIIDDAVVTQPTEVVIALTSTDETCFGAEDGTATATASGGVAPYFYIWNDPDNQTGPTAVGLASGTYEIEAIDDDGCFALNIVDIFGAAQIDYDITSTDETGFMASDGTAEVTLVSGGTAPFTYIWSNGATTSAISGLAPGTYECSATDGTGCETVLTAIVQQFGCGMGLDVLISTDASCNGAADGSMTVTLVGGTAPITYAWDNGGSTATISGLTAGTYSVTATDADGCAVTGLGAVNEPTAVQASVAITGLSANASNDGSATASGAGGTAPYTYLWSTGATTETITGLAPGTYNVIIADVNGCSDDTDVVIDAFGCTFTADSIQIIQNVVCFGASDGSAAPIITAGTGPYAFNWSNGSVDSLLTGVPSGTYFVTITDGTNCTDTLMNIISQPDSFAIAVTTTSELSNGGNDGTATAMVSGGTAPYSYLWSDGQITQTAVNLMPANYNVTCTDVNGCEVEELQIPVQAFNCTMALAASSSASATCFGFSDGSASANVISGINPITFEWSNGGTGAMISNLPEGSYQVIATDSTNCKDTADVVVMAPDSFYVDITVVDESSAGANNGTATALAVGGTPVYSFQWSTGATTPSVTGLMPGTYTLSCTDENGCQVIVDDVEVLEFNCDLEIDDLTAVDALCFGGTDGSLTPIISGQVDPVTYAWSTGSSATVLTGVASGTYDLTITDAANCADTISGFIDEPTELAINLSVTDETSQSANDGTATVAPSGGTPNYTVEWSTGQNSNSIANLTPGNYSVSVTDANNCLQTEPIFIQAFGCDLQITSATPTDVTCFGDSDGTATPILQGGAAPFSFDWSNSSADSVLTGVSGGIYTLTVTDSDNCFDTVIVNIAEPDELQANISGTGQTGLGTMDGTAMVNPSGGTSPYRVNWSTGDTGNSISGLAPGNYSAIIFDGNNCETTADFTVVPFDCLLKIDTLVAQNVQCFGDMNGSVRSFVSGGAGTVIYNWSSGETTPDLSGLNVGNYTLTVRDSLGCTDMKTTSIIQPSALSIDSFRIVNLECFGEQNGSVQSFVTGGTAPYNFNWSNGAQTDNIANLDGGRYGLLVTDDNNCVAIDTADVFEPTEILLTVSKTDETAEDADDGTAMVVASGGTGTLTYTWSNGEMTSSITDLAPGNYDVSVSDENGCEKNASVTINEFGANPCDLFVDTLIVADVICFGESNGSIAPILGGGTAPFNFNWSNMTGDSIAANLVTGQYILVVNDAEGCTATDTTFVNQPDELLVTATGTDETFVGQNDGSAQAVATGGTGAITWSWSNGEVVDSIGGLAPNDYTATATDANGCEASAMVTIGMGQDTVATGVCTTFAGEMSTDLLTACGLDTAFAENVGTPILDANDVLQYFLHDNSTDSIGAVLQISDQPNFGFASGMSYNTTYYISAVAGNADVSGNVDLADTCLSVIAGQPVEFALLPQPIYAVQGPNLACGNEPFFLIANDLYTGDDVNYFWHLPTGEVIITADPELVFTPNSENYTGDYAVSRDSAGCSSLRSGELFVEVVIFPDNAVDAGEDQILCTGQQATIEVISNISQPGKWRSLGFSTVVRPTEFISQVVDLQPGSNKFVWEVPLNECGAGASDTVDIIIEQPPRLIEDFYTLTNADDRVRLDILANDLLQGVVDTGLTILGTPDFGRIELDDDGFYYFLLDEAQRGQITLDYEVCNLRAECTTPCSTARFNINVKALPVLPEGLTPNGDGRNDFLEIKGIKGFQRIEIVIANRWGDVVYENKNYTNGDPWGGTRGTSGIPLPQGAYYYSVKAIENGVQVEDDIRGVVHIFN